MSDSNQEDVITVRVPSNLSIRDIIVIVSTIVTITLAWGVFSTRLTVIERELVTINARIDELKTMLSVVNARVWRLENHQAEDEIFIDDLYTGQRRPHPQRRASP